MGEAPRGYPGVRARRISVDPGDWVLKTTPDLQVRIAILKGQQLVAQNDLIGALAEYKQAREILSGLPPERRRQEARGLASAASTLKHGMDSYVLHGKTAPNPTRPSQNQAVTLH